MLSETIKIKVRFSEIDSLKIVWHGNYLQYMEDAREAFCNKYGIGYAKMYNEGYVAPIYDLKIKYRGTASLDDELLVKITYLESRGAKLMFEYQIYNADTGVLIFEAESTQLFMTLEGEFTPTTPAFYEEWKRNYDLLC